MAFDGSLSDGRKIFAEFRKCNKEVKKLTDGWTDEIVIESTILTQIFNPTAIILSSGIFNETYLTDLIREVHK